MKHIKFLFLLVACYVFVMAEMAFEAAPYYIASQGNIDRLKQDLRSKRLQIGITTLGDVRSLYGDARSVVDNEASVVYDYGDLTVNFEKKRVLKTWVIDSSLPSADDEKTYRLKSALGRTVIPGHATLENIISDYTKPSKTFKSDREANVTICYFGDLVLTFNEVTIMSSWQANEMPDQYSSERGVLLAGPHATVKKPSTKEATKTAEKEAPAQ